MGKVVVVENVTLDGVMQAPGGADEDPRGGLRHGGWAQPYADQVVAEKMGFRGMSEDGGLLFGRRTYEQFYGFWSKQTDGNPYTEVLNRRHKYVASRSLAEPLLWQNSSLLKGDAAEAVAALSATLRATWSCSAAACWCGHWPGQAWSTSTRCPSTRSRSARGRGCSPRVSTRTARWSWLRRCRRRPG